MIYDRMTAYQKLNIYPFHMPGHKRQPLEIFDGVHPFEIDYTEVDGLDDLHEPEEMFRDSMNMAKQFYGTKEIFYLVNGSTSGIMASIAAVCDFGDTIIVGRNCHKSVYKAIELLGLHPVYIYPQTELENGLVTHIDCEDVRMAVDNHPQAKAVMLVSPTYEGNLMNIKEISMCIKAHDMALIVDEAHGAHLPFCDSADEKYQTAISSGADLVIQSLHKTMPALTQTALLHVCSDKVAVQKVKESLSYFLTTSPSYLFSASIDYAIRYGIKNREAFEKYDREIRKYRAYLNERLQHLYLAAVDDPGKLVISTARSDMTGRELYDILLSTYHLQMEMVQESYVLAMTSVCDTKEGYQRLAQALIEIDGRIKEKDVQEYLPVLIHNEIVCTPYEAKRHAFDEVPLKESAGRVSAEYVYLYPPGIPLIVPGERISQACIDKMEEYERKHLKMKGFEGAKEGILKVFG